VVFLRPDRVDVLTDAAEVQRLALQVDLAGLDQVVLDVGVAQIPAVRRPGHAGAVAVPVEQIERRRLLA